MRFAANAWGLGLIPVRPAGFDPLIHVWGRPFFVTGTTSDAIAATIDRYLAADPESVQGIIREQLEQLEPGLAERVQPDQKGTLPSATSLEQGARQWPTTLRHAVRTLKSGQDLVITPSGEAQSARAMVQRDLPFVALELMAVFRPGWMSRGTLWPTRLLANTPTVRNVLPQTACVQAVVDAHPDLAWRPSTSIHENYMVGGVIDPVDIPEWEQAFEVFATADPWEAANRRKLLEAFADAKLRGFGFAEVTELYQAGAGILN